MAYKDHKPHISGNNIVDKYTRLHRLERESPIIWTKKCTSMDTATANIENTVLFFLKADFIRTITDVRHKTSIEAQRMRHIVRVLYGPKS